MKRSIPNRSMLSIDKPLSIEKEPPKQIGQLKLDKDNYCPLESKASKASNTSNASNASNDSNRPNDAVQKEIKDLLQEFSTLRQRINKITQRLDELRR